MNRKNTRTLSMDSRGRITLPTEIRKTADTFVLETREDGAIVLIPQKIIPIQEAKLLAALKRSVAQYHIGETVPVPDDWVE